MENKENKITKYGVIVGIVTLALQHCIYLLGHWLAELINITPYSPKWDLIDNAITIIPIFILPYVWSYIHWALTPMVVSKCKLDHFLDFCAAMLFTCLAGALVLAFAPTYMDRVEEGLTSVKGETFLWKFMQFWYSLDGGDLAYNLLPSFHCLNTTICFLGVVNRKEISTGFKIYSGIISILIFAATCFVKQHYFLDVVAGIVLGVIGYFVSVHWHLGRVFNRPIAYFKGLKEKKQN